MNGGENTQRVNTSALLHISGTSSPHPSIYNLEPLPVSSTCFVSCFDLRMALYIEAETSVSNNEPSNFTRLSPEDHNSTISDRGSVSRYILICLEVKTIGLPQHLVPSTGRFWGSQRVTKKQILAEALPFLEDYYKKRKPSYRSYPNR